MAVDAAVLSDQLSTSASGTVDFAETGFGTPDAAIVYISAANNTNPVTSSTLLSVGYWDGTTQGSAGLYDGNNRFHEDDAVGKYPASIDYTISNITNGIRITTSAATTPARWATVILLKGLTGAVVGWTNASSVSSLGIDPNFIFFAGVGAGNMDGTSSLGIFAQGMARIDGTSTITNHCQAYYAANERHNLLTDKCTAQQYTTLSWSISVSSFDTGGWTFSAAPGGGDYVLYLALELPDADDGYLEIIDTKGSTGTDAITGVGFTPAVVGFMATGSTATGYDATSEGMFLGADDGTTAQALTWAFEPGGGVDECEKASYSVFVASGGTAVTEGKIDSFDSDGYTLNYTTSSTATKVIAWGFGDSTGGAGATVPLMFHHYQMAGGL